MANEKNLKPFKKGQSGNPKGKIPGTKNRATLLKQWLSTPVQVENPATKKQEKATVEDEIILALINKAKDGDVQAIKEVQDTLYGKIRDSIPLNLNMTMEQLRNMSDDELDQLQERLLGLTTNASGYTPTES